MSIRKASDWFEALPATLTDEADRDRRRASSRRSASASSFLVDVGLDYLTLSRASGTLSGGESQRIRLASQIGSGLTGVLYVLDEPSIGLHQRDNARLLDTLRHLRDLGNTVIVVEHDEDAIRRRLRRRHRPGRRHPRRRDRRRGHAGGDHGQPGLADRPVSLRRDARSRCRPTAGPPKKGKELRSRRGARGNNLKNVTVEIPLGLFTCVTGVSGGGKSTLLIDTLYRAVARRLQRRRDAPGRRTSGSRGWSILDKVIDIDQSPIGRTPRSNPATYTGAFTPIREWFAGLPEAKARGYEPGRFSFNVKGGRCEACQGDGVIKIEMHFLPDVYVTCDVCKGKRYNRETLEVTFKGKSIADVLDMTVEEATDFFAAVPSIRDKMETLDRVGLGYIQVGQQATTLSGGEAQRVKLSKELSSAPPAAPSTSSTSRPPACISTTSPSSSRCCTSWSSRATRWSSSSTISRSSRPPTGSSTSAPKAATAAARSSPPARRRTSSRTSAATPASSSSRCWPAASRHARAEGAQEAAE